MLLRRIISNIYARHYSYNASNTRNQILENIGCRIRSCGPLTVADYMKEVLTGSTESYYVKKDMIGAQGDFITSPELSQIFGEIVGIWCLYEWMKLGSPKPLQIVELGPGRGTLISDVLKVFKHYNAVDAVKVYLLEISNELRRVQQSYLAQDQFCSENTCISIHGPEIHWVRDLCEIPQSSFSIFLAHEFFDALPVHIFQRKKNNWHEVLVDIDPKSETLKLRFVLSSRSTLSSRLLIKEGEPRDHVEISPISGMIVEKMSSLIVQSGGFALIMDYGHGGEKADTLRSFKDHQQVDPLSDPGNCDLTTDVDFKYIQDTVNAHGNCITYGPTSQREFLLNMGGLERMEKLCHLNKLELNQLKNNFQFITSPVHMGEVFKVLSIFPDSVQPIHTHLPPAGFFSTKNKD